MGERVGALVARADFDLHQADDEDDDAAKDDEPSPPKALAVSTAGALLGPPGGNAIFGL